MKYDVQFTNRFRKDLKLAKKQKRDIEKLLDVVEILANGGELDPKFRDHALSGEYTGTRECHIEPDWLLVYRIGKKKLILILLATGTHSDLF